MRCFNKVPTSFSDLNSFVFLFLFFQGSHFKFKQNAITVAGGNREGDQLNQLFHPCGLYVDDEQQVIYVADCHNHRIVKWRLGADNGEIVAGGNGKGQRIDQLYKPTHAIVDQKTKDLFICDRGNSRIVRWSMKNQLDREIIISDIDCYGLMMNGEGDLFVSHWEKHAVQRWRKGEKDGAIVAGGNAQGDRLDQLSGPASIFVDHNDTVYVSDEGNHRVVKWLKGAKEGIVVGGQQCWGNTFKALSHPEGIAVNGMGDVYVTDCGNHRIMCWSSRSKEGRVVVGGNGYGLGSNQLNSPTGLSFDADNNLYVVDRINNRIQRFDVDKTFERKNF